MTVARNDCITADEVVINWLEGMAMKALEII